MKNYYNSKLELENAKDRIIILEHDIEDIKLKLLKITGSLENNNSSSGSRVQSKIHTYTIQKIAKEEELKEKKEQVNFLEPIVEAMGKRVNAMVGLKKEVFEMFYGKNIKPKHIALLKDYSVQRIYQLLDEVNEELGLK